MKVCISVLCVIAVMAATVALSGSGYVVILKNGERIRCDQPLKIEGNLAIITLVTHQVTSYPVDQVDLVATERYNRLGLGSALTLDALDAEGTMPPTPTPRATLGNYATISGTATDSELSTKAAPTVTPTPGIKLQTAAFGDERVTTAFIDILDKKNLYLYRTSVGSQPDYFFIQAVTDTQREVFHTLKVVAEAYMVISTRRPDLAPKAVELRMVETSGRPAGTFRISPEDATKLVEGDVTPENFYVSNVIF